MTMGLILLGIMMISLLFSWGQTSYRGLGLPAWGAFVAVLALGIGIIVPSVRFSSVLTMNVGGFILPVIAMLLLIVPMVRSSSVWMGIVGMLAVTAATVGLLFVMPIGSAGFRVLTAITIGLVVGAIAFIIGRHRSAAVFAVMGGVTLGNLIYALLQYFVLDAVNIALGTSVIYNSIFLGTIFALALAVAAMRTGRDVASHRRRSLNFEASEDREFDELVGEDDNFDETLF